MIYSLVEQRETLKQIFGMMRKVFFINIKNLVYLFFLKYLFLKFTKPSCRYYIILSGKELLLGNNYLTGFFNLHVHFFSTQ